MSSAGRAGAKPGGDHRRSRATDGPDPRQPPAGRLQHRARGVPYASAEYRPVRQVAGAELSRSRAGNPYDNAARESCRATYQREGVALAEEAGGRQ